jgi:hypothetical protein
MALFLDTGLYHPDIRDDRCTGIQRSEGSRNRIPAEPQKTSHREVADRNRTPLPDPVLDRCIADSRTGKAAGFL